MLPRPPEQALIANWYHCCKASNDVDEEANQSTFIAKTPEPYLMPGVPPFSVDCPHYHQHEDLHRGCDG